MRPTAVPLGPAPPNAQPPAEQPPPATTDKATSTQPTTGKGKKGKKKKLSKKELARLRREKAEQERLEQEQREIALRNQREKEYEMKKRTEQQQRLLEEDQDLKQLTESRKAIAQAILQKRAQEEDWRIFQECSHSVDIRSQSEVNTFISQWDDVSESDFQTLFEAVNQANSIIAQLTSRMQRAEIAGTPDTTSMPLIQSLRSMIYSKIGSVTNHHLSFSDKFSGAKNEIIVNATSEPFSVGLWVNLSKNPRNKEIDFPGMSIEVSKNLAMMSVAMRVLRTPNDLVDSEYLFLDRLFTCELLQLPMPPKKVGGMTLRQSPGKNPLVVLPYPLRNVTSTQAPLNFKIAVDPACVTEYTKEMQVVMIVGGKVDTQHVTKYSFDPNTCTMSFTSISSGVFSLAIPKYTQFPLQYWEISGLSNTSAQIYLKTSHEDEIEIDINEEGLCSMANPFTFKDLTPTATIELLQQKGMNLVAPASIEKIQPKNADLEELLYRGIADCATGFTISCSKWNSVLAGDRAMVLVSEKKTFEARDDEKAPTPRAILAKSNHVTEVAYSEEMSEFDPKPLENARIHLHIMPMFLDSACQEVQARVRSTPTFLSNSIMYILRKLRLFSVTQ